MTGFVFGTHSGQSERRAAVAGSFYPSDPSVLQSDIEHYLKSAEIVSDKTPKLLIAPHAGYSYSGVVAAKGYAHCSHAIKKVILIGPSHYQGFSGVAYPEASWYLTPLGKVKVDANVIGLLKSHPKARPMSGFDEKEHSLEVQIPFLQVKLDDFTVTPLLTGRIDPAELAEMLLPFIDDVTIVIASSDFSHYHTQNDARKLDDCSISTILGDNIQGPIDGCGEVAIRTIMHLARRLKLEPVLLDAKTSYETSPECCCDDRVVGYASIVYFNQTVVDKNMIEENEVDPAAFSKELQQWMLSLARTSLTAAVHGKELPMPDQIPAVVKEMRGCFITLTQKGSLRGCIGYIEPIKPLYQAIIENARNAALHDHRFSPLSKKEVETVSIEVSVLTKPQPLVYKTPEEFINKLRAGIDGVILCRGDKQSTFLPQVWEQLPQKVDFLEHLALKAGMARDEWKTASAKIYSAEHFREKGPNP